MVADPLYSGPGTAVPSNTSIVPAVRTPPRPNSYTRTHHGVTFFAREAQPCGSPNRLPAREANDSPRRVLPWGGASPGRTDHLDSFVPFERSEGRALEVFLLREDRVR